MIALLRVKNDGVTIGADYAVLWFYLGQTSGETLDKCGFNRDGAVTGVDHSWRGITLDTYGICGECD